MKHEKNVAFITIVLLLVTSYYFILAVVNTLNSTVTNKTFNENNPTEKR